MLAAWLQVDNHIERQYDSAVKIAVTAASGAGSAVFHWRRFQRLPPSASTPGGPNPDPDSKESPCRWLETSCPTHCPPRLQFPAPATPTHTRETAVCGNRLDVRLYHRDGYSS